MVDLCWGMEVVVIVEEEEADKSSSQFGKFVREW